MGYYQKITMDKNDVIDPGMCKFMIEGKCMCEECPSFKEHCPLIPIQFLCEFSDLRGAL